MNRTGHLPALDGIRGIAILVVMLFHFAICIDRHTPFWDGLRTAMSFGWSGVDLFFVLSGFLITGILIETRSAANYFRSFYLRRVLRIFPAYYALLGILLLGSAAIPSLAKVLPPAPDWGLYAVYLQNWTVLLTKPGQMLVGHFWSLAVEEQFYLVWPFAVFFTSRRQLTVLAILCSMAALVIRNWLVHTGIDGETVYRNTFTRMDSLLIGALTAIAFRVAPIAEWAARRTSSLLVIGLACVGAGPLLARSMSNVNAGMLSQGMSFLGLGHGFLVFAAATAAPATALHRGLSWKPLRTLGVYSYGLYLYHLPALHLLIWIENVCGVRLPGPWNIPLAALVTAGLSLASYNVVERPALAMKYRFRARRDARKIDSPLSATEPSVRPLSRVPS